MVNGRPFKELRGPGAINRHPDRRVLADHLEGPVHLKSSSPTTNCWADSEDVVKLIQDSDREGRETGFCHGSSNSVGQESKRKRKRPPCGNKKEGVVV